MTNWRDEARDAYQRLEDLRTELQRLSRGREDGDPLAAIERARRMLELSAKMREASTRLRVIAEGWRHESSRRIATRRSGSQAKAARGGGA